MIKLRVVWACPPGPFTVSRTTNVRVELVVPGNERFTVDPVAVKVPGAPTESKSQLNEVGLPVEVLVKVNVVDS
jgi:hypothetical protein